MSKENFDIVKKLINAKRTNGIEEKIAKLLLYGQLTEQEYELCQQLLNK